MTEVISFLVCVSLLGVVFFMLYVYKKEDPKWKEMKKELDKFMKATDFICSNCGDKLYYNSILKAYQCKKCGSVVVEELK